MAKSSKQWLRRHVTDPYVKKAREQGYRSRAAFKLLELDAVEKILKPGMTVVDPADATEMAAAVEFILKQHDWKAGGKKKKTSVIYFAGNPKINNSGKVTATSIAVSAPV